MGLTSLGDAHETPERPFHDELMPTLRARDITGAPFALEETLQDGPVLLVVWFSDCPTCPRALQRLLDWAAAQPEAPRVVGVNGDPAQDRAWLRPFLRRSELELTVLADPDGDLRRGLGLEQSPAVVLIQREAGDTHVVRHQPSERVSMDGLARSWIEVTEAGEGVLATR